jgi:hypothetical protein
MVCEVRSVGGWLLSYLADVSVQSERNEWWGDHVDIEVRSLVLSMSRCALLGSDWLTRLPCDRQFQRGIAPRMLIGG